MEIECEARRLFESKIKLLETSVAQLVCTSKTDTLVANAIIIGKLDVYKIIYGRVTQKVA